MFLLFLFLSPLTIIVTTNATTTTAATAAATTIAIIIIIIVFPTNILLDLMLCPPVCTIKKLVYLPKIVLCTNAYY